MIQRLTLFLFHDFRNIVLKAFIELSPHPSMVAHISEPISINDRDQRSGILERADDERHSCHDSGELRQFGREEPLTHCHIHLGHDRLMPFTSSSNSQMPVGERLSLESRQMATLRLSVSK